MGRGKKSQQRGQGRLDLKLELPAMGARLLLVNQYLPIFTSSGFCVGLDQYLDFERAWTNIFTMRPLVRFQQGLKGLKR